jgi:hypothetical protein
MKRSEMIEKIGKHIQTLYPDKPGSMRTASEVLDIIETDGMICFEYLEPLNDGSGLVSCAWGSWEEVLHNGG